MLQRVYVTVLARLGSYRASGELHRDLLLEGPFQITSLLRGKNIQQREMTPAAEDVALACPVIAVMHAVHMAPSELLWLSLERLERFLITGSHQ